MYSSTSLWSTANLEKDYKFFYKDYRKTHNKHHIRVFRGTIFEFMKFAQNIKNIVLCKTEEYNMWEDEGSYTYYKNSYSSSSYWYCGHYGNEDDDRIKMQKTQKRNTFSKVNNNWNSCKNYNKRFK